MSLYKGNLGPGRASLATVGYALKNANHTVAVARTTVGITESPAASGIYYADVTPPANFDGYIEWDSGEASPAVASQLIRPDATPDYGIGSVTFPYTVTVNGVSYGGAYVTFFSDLAKSVRKAYGFTGADGVITVMLDPGTYYINVVLRDGTVNTDTEVVA